MTLLNKNILVPVNFPAKSASAIKKTLEKAGQGSTIHLLHVLPYPGTSIARHIKGCFNDVFESRAFMRAEVKMHELRESILAKNNNVRVTTWIEEDKSLEKAIEKKSIELDIDLIVLGRNLNRSWLWFMNIVNSRRLALKTGKNVMTVKKSPGDQLKTSLISIKKANRASRDAIIAW